MDIGIITLKKFDGKESVGSSRIRGEWVANHWDDAEIYKYGKKYDVVIYQKAYWPEHARDFDGLKILDICDPDFFHWNYPIKETIVECDAVTASTEELAKQFRNFTDSPVKWIDDRVDVEAVDGQMDGVKQHEGKAKKVVWYGYSQNFPMLKPAVKAINDNNLELIVISDNSFRSPAPYRDLPVTNYRHNWETVYGDIQEGDIVLNPQGTSGQWKYKSKNKTYLAWALGMPVAHSDDELENFIDAEARQQEAKEKRQLVKEKHHSKQSVVEYKELIDSLQN